ncbi:hypothetical protein JOC78_002582 [Bacillus ectoiniformans]|uniref:hypothetical protein n=1 Tax=Bacillus ectoiniformans TaxID=1494429 RepID=UPI00195B3BD3|nr:hypothetical protein [Bacillus ectoiniformans]MBM7649608.1 hypothetical protein [Bacillus ectoiniformans]
MGALLVIILLSIVSAIKDVPPLFKTKEWKTLVVYFAVLILGISLTGARAFQVQVPNPLDFVQLLSKPLTDWFMSFLK